jgi:exonuclease III
MAKRCKTNNRKIRKNKTRKMRGGWDWPFTSTKNDIAKTNNSSSNNSPSNTEQTYTEKINEVKSTELANTAKPAEQVPKQTWYSYLMGSKTQSVGGKRRKSHKK